MDNREELLGREVKLELHRSDFNGTITSLSQVMIITDKEIIEIVPAGSIVQLSANVWEITLTTSSENYRSGNFTDRWYLNGLTSYVDKEFELTASTERAVNTLALSDNVAYYSKDLTYQTDNTGDFGRIYNKDSIRNKVLTVINTVKGSLIMESNHGTNLWKILFSPAIDAPKQVEAELKYELESQIPEISVASINASINVTDNTIVEVDLQYFIRPAVSTEQLQTVNTVVRNYP